MTRTEPTSPMTTSTPTAPLPRTPFVLLGLMTLATLIGPLAIILVLRGGTVRAWPPDRPVEWVTLVGVVSLVATLMVGCVGVASRTRRREVEAKRLVTPPRSDS